MEKTNWTGEPCSWWRDRWDSWWDGVTERWHNLGNRTWTEEFRTGRFFVRATVERYQWRYYRSMELCFHCGEHVDPEYKWDLRSICEAVVAYSNAERWFDQFPVN